MNRIYDFLRSDKAILLFLVLALVAQVPHAADVFHRIIPYGPAVCDAQSGAPSRDCLLEWGHAYAYAIALESAILVFVMRGKMKLSWGFAFVSVLVNVGYYWSDAWVWDALTSAVVADMLRAALVSLALPGAIAFYSHEVGGKHEAPPMPTEPPIEWVPLLAAAVRDAIGEVQVEASLPASLPDAWVEVLVDAVLDALPDAPTEVPMPAPMPALPAGWGINALVDASMPRADASQGICYASGCEVSSEPCPHCGHPVCPKHNGTHKRWHCTHNPESKAYRPEPVPSNGHAKEPI